MANFYAQYPASSGGSANASVGTNGITAPTSSTEVGGVNPSGNLQPLQTDASGNLLVNIGGDNNPVTVVQPTGSLLHTTVDASALPTGASTSALQTSGNNTLASILSDQTNGTQLTGIYQGGNTAAVTASSALKVDGSAVTQPVSAASLPLPTGAATSANQATEITSLATIATNTTGAALDSHLTNTQSAPGTSQTVAVTIQGNSSGIAVPVSVGSSSLPTGAATSALQSSVQGTVAAGTAATNSQLAGMVYSSTTPAPTNGQQLAVQSDQYGNVLTTSPDIILTGQSAQTALVNNILTATAGTAASLVSNYRSASVQVTSTGTAGAFIFEGSNDNVNFASLPVYNQVVTTGTPIVGAITVSASSLVYTFPITTQYIRLRISTAITGGSVQAFTRISQAAWSPAVVQVAQSTAASLATTATIASGTVTTVSTVTSNNTAIPGLINDVASAAITTTTTTGTITPTFGSSYTVDIPVTAVTGTTPTLQVTVQESPDGGTNWYNVYAFPTITATGSYTSPVITLTGTRVRYVQTVGGTTPSFTRAINRLQSSQSGYNVPTGGNLTDASGTTSGTVNTSTQIVGFNALRKYLLIQNVGSSTIWINFTSAATTTQPSFELLPGGSLVQESGFVSGEAINVISSSASVPYTAKWA